MYEYINGIFVGINKDYIVVDNNGMGYKIYTSGSTMAKMPKTNEHVLLYIKQIVREDFIGLYGFLTKEEIEMFSLVISINGVGSKAGLSLLSICSVTNLKYAIVSGDEKTLIRAPGIGKKIAQRIILELREKIHIEQSAANTLSQISGSNLEDDRKLIEVLGALISLGYSEKEAEKALKAISKEQSLENMIKDCLKYLMN
ncbi:Holliday junction branch migration protein RuvA [Clostridium sp. CM028]|uniref:Holliday junction branch migration protein RuvA n=1 Tax=Clostridium TaxID=1485 RepID=UPI0013EED7AD|nr:MULTISPECIES: Holliday junction branch migration protein RuvA [Clostridium]MBU3091896.1 Holliday junction branch migration protein RuvA [Clostridium sp. CF011]MBW9145733.1 Holliday junction branch migration protein RuvA [Clostridium sp. CM027]MBW9147745.1 Holliday junction branch migration protein RuvA [Clostridium sp. CM028]MBZ9608117.1 Holliday junction branch migration protein RuvA [Clostridium estertheticum]UVE41419.1 Holliday junction branch migration protein RuvA [Clostridium sp. CM02